MSAGLDEKKKQEVYEAVAERDLRWIRKNIFGDEPSSGCPEFSMKALLDNKEDFIKGYFDTIDDNKIEAIREQLWVDSEKKQKVLLFAEGVNPFPVDIENNPGYNVVENCDLSKDLNSLIPVVEQYRDDDVSALFYLESGGRIDIEDIKVKISYIVGQVGRENANILFGQDAENIKALALQLDVVCTYFPLLTS